jgi:hypothetical protein
MTEFPFIVLFILALVIGYVTGVLHFGFRLRSHVGQGVHLHLGTPLVPSTVDAISGSAITPEALAEWIRHEQGQDFKASWTAGGFWDMNSSEGHAEVAHVNDGDGPKPAVVVKNELGLMVYTGPFRLEHAPTDDRLLLFYCTYAVFIGPPEKEMGEPK